MSPVGNILGKLFSGGSSGGGNEAAVRAYGKLPMYAEYRRLEVSPGTPTEFSGWLDEGRLAWVQSTGSQGTSGSMRASRMMLQLPGAKEAVVASIWDSRDSLGRVFPFCFFIVCAPDALGGSVVERWVSAAGLFQYFDRLYSELTRLGGGGDFYKMFRGRTTIIRPDDLDEKKREMTASAAQIASQDWYAALKLNRVPGEKWFPALARRAQGWVSDPSSVAAKALAIPLAESFSTDQQALIWLHWIERVAAKSGRMPWVIAPSPSAHDSGARLSVLLRDVLPHDFQLLTTLAAEYQYVDQLADVVDDSQAAAGEMPSVPLLTWLTTFAMPPAS
jgi:hypothetical protein